MRIIAGKYRGKQLKVPKGDATRPTTDRVKESIFNLLFSRMEWENARVLDLFSGTGALGLEAISRGAKEIVSIETNRTALECAKQNAANLGVEKQCWFQLSEAVGFIKRYKGQPFNVIFADPPYELPELPNLPEMILPHLTPDGWLVLEHDKYHNFDDHPLLETSRAYGRTIVSVFTPLMNEEEEETDNG